MNRKYYMQNSLVGFAFLMLAVVAFYQGDEFFYIDVGLVSFMLFSTLLYPFSRHLILVMVFRLKPQKSWGKFFSEPDIFGGYVLFIFACIVLAIPLGGCYLTYIACKRWRSNHPV
ncbi:hypothetical protein D3C73_965000 [compost metagenome]